MHTVYNKSTGKSTGKSMINTTTRLFPLQIHPFSYLFLNISFIHKQQKNRARILG